MSKPPPSHLYSSLSTDADAPTTNGHHRNGAHHTDSDDALPSSADPLPDPDDLPAHYQQMRCAVTVLSLVVVALVALLCLALLYAYLGHSSSLTLLTSGNSSPSSPSLAPPSLPTSPAGAAASEYAELLRGLTRWDRPGSPLPAVCLGHDWLGRFGNNLFELMFLLTMALRHSMRMYVHVEWANYHTLVVSMMYPVEWCPTEVVLNDASKIRPRTVRVREAADMQWGDWANTHPYAANRSVGGGGEGDQVAVYYDGFFQLPMPGYEREAILALLRPRPHVYGKLMQLWYALLVGIPPQTLIVGIHVRKGDYSDDADAMFRRIPNDWFYSLLTRLQANSTLMQDALQQQDAERDRLAPTANHLIPIQPTFCLPTTPSSPSSSSSPSPSPSPSPSSPPSTSPTSPRLCLLLISDEFGSVREDFTNAGYTVVTPHEVTTTYADLFQLAMGNDEQRWVYRDWWFLSRTHVTAISHSTFSFTSTLFNEHQQTAYFYRPNGTTHTLRRYRPWESHFYSTLGPWMAKVPVPDPDLQTT